MTQSSKNCSCCKDERINNDKEPREMVSIQVEGIKHLYFLCGFCDGDAVVLAKALESERSRG